MQSTQTSAWHHVSFLLQSSMVQTEQYPIQGLESIQSTGGWKVLYTRVQHPHNPKKGNWKKHMQGTPRPSLRRLTRVPLPSFPWAPGTLQRWAALLWAFLYRSPGHKGPAWVFKSSSCYWEPFRDLEKSKQFTSVCWARKINFPRTSQNPGPHSPGCNL